MIKMMVPGAIIRQKILARIGQIFFPCGNKTLLERQTPTSPHVSPAMINKQGISNGHNEQLMS
jgi:hypothetical protein